MSHQMKTRLLQDSLDIKQLCKERGLPPFEGDIELLIDNFCWQVQHGAQPSLALFKQLWNSMQFSFIHQAVPTILQPHDYVQLLFSAAINRIDHSQGPFVTAAQSKLATALTVPQADAETLDEILNACTNSHMNGGQPRVLAVQGAGHDVTPLLTATPVTGQIFEGHTADNAVVGSGSTIAHAETGATIDPDIATQARTDASPSLEALLFNNQLMVSNEEAARNEVIKGLASSVGALYCLYCLYETQVHEPRLRIYMPLVIFQHIIDLVPKFASVGLQAPIKVLQKMYRESAFVIGALRKPRHGEYVPPKAQMLPGKPAPAFNDIMNNRAVRDALLHLRTNLQVIADFKQLSGLHYDYDQARKQLFAHRRPGRQRPGATFSAQARKNSNTTGAEADDDDDAPPYIYSSDFPQTLEEAVVGAKAATEELIVSEGPSATQVWLAKEELRKEKERQKQARRKTFWELREKGQSAQQSKKSSKSNAITDLDFDFNSSDLSSEEEDKQKERAADALQHVGGIYGDLLRRKQQQQQKLMTGSGAGNASGAGGGDGANGKSSKGLSWLRKALKKAGLLPPETEALLKDTKALSQATSKAAAAVIRLNAERQAQNLQCASAWLLAHERLMQEDEEDHDMPLLLTGPEQQQQEEGEPGGAMAPPGNAGLAGHAENGFVEQGQEQVLAIADVAFNGDDDTGGALPSAAAAGEYNGYLGDAEHDAARNHVVSTKSTSSSLVVHGVAAASPGNKVQKSKPVKTSAPPSKRVQAVSAAKTSAEPHQMHPPNSGRQTRTSQKAVLSSDSGTSSLIGDQEQGGQHDDSAGAASPQRLTASNGRIKQGKATRSSSKQRRTAARRGTAALVSSSDSETSEGSADVEIDDSSDTPSEVSSEPSYLAADGPDADKDDTKSKQKSRAKENRSQQREKAQVAGGKSKVTKRKPSIAVKKKSPSVKAGAGKEQALPASTSQKALPGARRKQAGAANGIKDVAATRKATPPGRRSKVITSSSSSSSSSAVSKSSRSSLSLEVPSNDEEEDVDEVQQSGEGKKGTQMQKDVSDAKHTVTKKQAAATLKGGKAKKGSRLVRNDKRKQQNGTAGDKAKAGSSGSKKGRTAPTTGDEAEEAPEVVGGTASQPEAKQHTQAVDEHDMAAPLQKAAISGKAKKTTSGKGQKTQSKSTKTTTAQKETTDTPPNPLADTIAADVQEPGVASVDQAGSQPGGAGVASTRLHTAHPSVSGGVDGHTADNLDVSLWDNVASHEDAAHTATAAPAVSLGAGHSPQQPINKPSRITKSTKRVAGTHTNSTSTQAGTAAAAHDGHTHRDHDHVDGQQQQHVDVDGHVQHEGLEQETIDKTQGQQHERDNAVKETPSKRRRYEGGSDVSATRTTRSRTQQQPVKDKDDDVAPPPPPRTDSSKGKLQKASKSPAAGKTKQQGQQGLQQKQTEQQSVKKAGELMQTAPTAAILDSDAAAPPDSLHIHEDGQTHAHGDGPDIPAPSPATAVPSTAAAAVSETSLGADEHPLDVLPDALPMAHGDVDFDEDDELLRDASAVSARARHLIDEATTMSAALPAAAVVVGASATGAGMMADDATPAQQPQAPGGQAIIPTAPYAIVAAIADSVAGHGTHKEVPPLVVADAASKQQSSRKSKTTDDHKQATAPLPKPRSSGKDKKRKAEKENDSAAGKGEQQDGDDDGPVDIAKRQKNTKKQKQKQGDGEADGPASSKPRSKKQKTQQQPSADVDTNLTAPNMFEAAVAGNDLLMGIAVATGLGLTETQDLTPQDTMTLNDGQTSTRTGEDDRQVQEYEEDAHLSDMDDDADVLDALGESVRGKAAGAGVAAAREQQEPEESLQPKRQRLKPAVPAAKQRETARTQSGKTDADAKKSGAKTTKERGGRTAGTAATAARKTNRVHSTSTGAQQETVQHDSQMHPSASSASPSAAAVAATTPAAPTNPGTSAVGLSVMAQERHDEPTENMPVTANHHPQPDDAHVTQQAGQTLPSDVEQGAANDVGDVAGTVKQDRRKQTQKQNQKQARGRVEKAGTQQATPPLVVPNVTPETPIVVTGDADQSGNARPHSAGVGNGNAGCPQEQPVSTVQKGASGVGQPGAGQAQHDHVVEAAQASAHSHGAGNAAATLADTAAHPGTRNGDDDNGGAGAATAARNELAVVSQQQAASSMRLPVQSWQHLTGLESAGPASGPYAYGSQGPLPQPYAHYPPPPHHLATHYHSNAYYPAASSGMIPAHPEGHHQPGPNGAPSATTNNNGTPGLTPPPHSEYPPQHAQHGAVPGAYPAPSVSQHSQLPYYPPHPPPQYAANGPGGQLYSPYGQHLMQLPYPGVAHHGMPPPWGYGPPPVQVQQQQQAGQGPAITAGKFAMLKRRFQEEDEEDEKFMAELGGL